MAQCESWFKQDLKKPIKVQMLNGNLFSQDNQGNLIGVEVFDNGEPASLAGTVSANIIRADGGTVAATGTLSGNKCSVVLPAAAYAIPGFATIVIKLTYSGVVTTLLALAVTIYRSSTDTAVDPGTVMPSIQSLIQQINTAVASIPADYSSLWTSLAPAFSTDASYVAGQYITNNGKVYRFNTAHSGEWAAGDVSEVKLGNELTDLKSALIDAQKMLNGNNFLRFASKTYTSATVNYVSNGTTITANGQASSNSIFPFFSFTPSVSGLYRLSGCPSGGNTFRYYLCFQQFSAELYCDIGNGAGVPLVAGTEYTLWAVVANGYNASNLVFTPSLVFEKALLPTENRGLLNNLINDGSTALSPSVTSSGWGLVGNGSSVQDAKYQMKKYIVSAGQRIYLHLSKDGGGVYQWQNAENVPAAANANLIGDPVTTATDSIATVPSGATYLIISERTNNTSNIVRLLAEYEEKAPFTLIQSINPVFLAERFISHRGLVTAPENTIPAIKEAITSGYKIVEFDVRFTSDNVPVLIHDDTINRTARNADGTEISDTVYVASSTYSALQEYDFGIWKGSQYTGTTIPSLEDTLTVLKKNNVCCDMDLTALGDAVTSAQMTIIINTIKEAGMLGYVMFTNTGNGINTALSVDKNIIACISNVTSQSVIDAAFSIIKDCKMPCVSFQYPYRTQAEYNYAHSLGLMIKAFTFSDNPSINSNLNFKPDFQIIDTLKCNEIVLT